MSWLNCHRSLALLAHVTANLLQFLPALIELLRIAMQ